MLASCAASKPEKASEHQAIQAQIEELRERLDQQSMEWEQYRPGINRLTALESDFKTLISQLDKMASSVPVAAPISIPKKVDDHKIPKAVNTSAEAIESSSHNTKGNQPRTPQYALQLGAYRDLKGIESNKRTLVKKSPEILLSKRFYLSPIDIGTEKARLYRLLAGPIKNKAAAQTLCRQLKADGLECITRPLTGKPLADDIANAK